MKTQYFINCTTLEELKKQYRKLAFTYHPDTGHGNEPIMKIINVEYEKLFKYITDNASTEQTAQNTKHGHGINDGYREIINSIIHLPGIIIEICGSWVWITGQTKQYKDILKSNGYYWAAKKLSWYWRPAEQKCTFNKKSRSMDYIRTKYGSESVQTQEYKQVAHAM